MQDKVERPWGSYQVLLEEPNIKVKKIIVKAGNRLSLQKHSRREEFWTIISGKGILTRGTAENLKKYYTYEEIVSSGSMIYIMCEELHRLEAIKEDIVFIETQKGDYLEEDDIVRYEDDYKRV